MSMQSGARQLSSTTADRAVAFGFPGVTSTGWMSRDVRGGPDGGRRARAGEGPTLVVAACYRFDGHHVGDLENYRSEDEAAAWHARDPIATFRGASGGRRPSSTTLPPSASRSRRRRLIAAAVDAAEAAPLPEPDRAWMTSTPPPDDRPRCHRTAAANATDRVITYAAALNEALAEEMARDPAVFCIGEDIAVWGGGGGVYGVTPALVERFGPERVRDTPVSEEGIVGLSVGAALVGCRPVAEIMYSDFLTLAMDPIVNQAAKMRYMFGGQASCRS